MSTKELEQIRQIVKEEVDTGIKRLKTSKQKAQENRPCHRTCAQIP